MTAAFDDAEHFSVADDTDADAGAGSGAASGTTSAGLAGLVFDDPLDRPSSDDTDRGWGEPAPGSADDDFARFLSEKPPHHI